ncbi:unnamed protein product [Phytophthora lilii]|uniref:Fucosyltransferase n=1 Tax=Phytophthora lilii TaxID=2077276 RepID=A0A9W6U8I8_9STRA|nr:unnamed protein product [Phytophthora lilii]
MTTCCVFILGCLLNTLCVISFLSPNTLGQGLGGVELGPEGVFRIQDDDPTITKFQVLYPADGDVETLPLEFRVDAEVTSVKQFKAHYEDKLLCVELNGTWRQCTPLSKPIIVFDDLQLGNYTARAFITDDEKRFRYHETRSTTVSIVSESDFEAYVAVMEKHSRDVHPEGENIVEWFRKQKETQVNRSLESDAGVKAIDGYLSGRMNSSTDILVIGVKTAVVENFELRQAIRQTWASTDVLPRDVKVFFIGCVPQLDALETEERNEIQKAIMMEKQTYGDLLTDELDCEDSYADLTNKVKQFMRFVVQSYPQTPFVMIADDNIYLRADRLAADLRKETREQRLYLGQVWDNLLARKQAPVRDVTKRYYVSEDTYPLDWYPPFAFGSHYLLSMDCARFIAKNSERLRGIGAVDDVSVALWLLTIQVHVERTAAFSNLRVNNCEDRLLSIAGLAPLSIRSTHANVVAQRAFCYGLETNHALTDGQSTQYGAVDELELHTFVHDLHGSNYLFVTTVLSTSSKAGVKVSYYPSVETFKAYSRRVCAEARTFLAHAEFKSWMCYAITRNLRTQVHRQFQIAKISGFANGAFLELWRYNLFVADEHAPPLIIAYTTESSYASVVFECIFTTIFERHKRPILVAPEKTLHATYENSPDVFVFSIFDADCDPMSNAICTQMIAHYMQYLDRVNQSKKPTKLMMISGEAIDTQSLDDRVPLLSSVSGLSREKHVYLPVASISFAERLLHTPMALLSPAPLSNSENRRFCAYLYARCERPFRESMFDLLNALEPVDALGKCAGSSRPPDESYNASRYAKWFNDEAVLTYQHYKFVVAFENSAEPGYITEKMVNPLLAGSIPIYLGNSATASYLFNPASYIDCNHFTSLSDCADFVLKVHRSPELYFQMRREPPIRNLAAFHEAFSWHPAIPSQALASHIATMLALN